MTADSPIEEDVTCQKCGYNLRTLAVIARCPECGYPVLRSLIAFEAGADQKAPNPRDPLQSQRVYRTALITLARLLHRNADSIEFVILAHRHARQRRTSSIPPLFRPRPVHLAAADLCRACAEYALERFGNRDDALATFRFWHLERGEDVGEIVAALVEAGLMTAGPSDSPADFHGVCPLADLLHTP